MRRLRSRNAVIAGLAALALVVSAMPAAFADPSYDTFDAKQGWACGVAEDLVDNHCINIRSQGNTLNIKVFEPDPRGPQESASTDPAADSRPCPHDDNADPDGTWWNFTGDPDEPLFVCHHSGQQQVLP
jgi:hypothetical protein